MGNGHIKPGWVLHLTVCADGIEVDEVKFFGGYRRVSYGHEPTLFNVAVTHSVAREDAEQVFLVVGDEITNVTKCIFTMQ